MLAGMASVRDSATSEAAVIWTIMKPDERPGSAGEEGRQPLRQVGIHQPLDPPLGDAPAAWSASIASRSSA